MPLSVAAARSEPTVLLLQRPGRPLTCARPTAGGLPELQGDHRGDGRVARARHRVEAADRDRERRPARPVPQVRRAGQARNGRAAADVQGGV